MRDAPHGPDVGFWQARFEQNQTPWDRGAPGPQLQRWLSDQTLHAGQRVAVPGCGSGHDVLALVQAGLHVTAIDYAPAALALTRERLAAATVAVHAEHLTKPDAGTVELVEADVLTYVPDRSFDVVYEQTCWCALHPDHWLTWSKQLLHWVRPGGLLLVMAMQTSRPSAAQGFIEGPPYHMDVHMLRALLPSDRWMWPAPPYEQVPHRMGREELAILLRRR